MRFSREEWQAELRDVYQGELEFAPPMKNYSYIGIGGPVELLASPADPLSLRSLVSVLERKGIPLLAIGAASNLLVADEGFDGAVIRLKEFTRIEVIREDTSFAELFVESGAPLQKLLRFCNEKGYTGLEGLAGIPGTVGGAIVGNAGSFGCEMRDVLDSVAIMDSRALLERFRAEGLGFGYRRSDIGAGDVVLSANLKCGRDEARAVEERFDRFLAEKRRNQPLAEKSLGCVFRNPHDAPAGKLIEDAGCKGMRIGDIEVSTLHANFFVNRGNGTADDYARLMHEVAGMVAARFGVALEPEIRIVGISSKGAA